MSNLSDRGTLRGTLQRNNGNYNDLINKPAINGHTLIGNQSGHALGLANEDDIINVEVNPLGPATADLHKILVDDTIYSVPDVVVYGTASGDIASFDDGGNDKPLKSLKVAINPVQEGSGTPTPSNPLPISGWTGANVTRCGKNLCTIFTDGKVPSISTGELVTAGGARSDFVKVLPSTNYIFSVESPAQQLYIFYYDINKNFIGYSSDTSLNVTHITPSNCYYCMIRTAANADVIEKPQLELGTTATTYEPYVGTTYPITWSEAGTVYGGKFDVTSGVLTINTLTKTIDGVNEQVSGVWGATTYGYAVYINMPVNKTENTICDKFKYTNKGYVKMELYTYVGGSGTQPTWTFVLPNTVTSKDEANDWFINNPTTLTYPLATPITVQLTPTQVKSLLGNNNIWSDTGDIDQVIYIRDLNLALNELWDLVHSNSGTRSLSLSKSAPIEEPKEEETKNEI